ncbi:hypothetical protein [Polaribacter sp. NJDZ03]|uniref:hypothetical protein n=1 Tax=Polaribacter sp. NJDZ03 TaxID=2855841 RepID=UPI001C4A11DE|nr:hypothetical protein [Polaribacter sp. NJDZ03]
MNEIKEKYYKKLDNFFKEIEKSMHSELFEEEYVERYDSSSEAAGRKNGVNPMNEEYILKAEKKREELGVSKLGANGLPSDNSSELYVKKILTDYLLQKQNNEKLEAKKKMNISSFFKEQK